MIGPPLDRLQTTVRPTRGFPVLLPHEIMCVVIGRYWYLFTRLTAVSASRFYRFEHIETYGSGQSCSKVRRIRTINHERHLKPLFPTFLPGVLFLEKISSVFNR